MLAASENHVTRNRMSAVDRARLTIWCQENAPALSHCSFEDVAVKANSEVVFSKPVSSFSVKTVMQSLGFGFRKKKAKPKDDMVVVLENINKTQAEILKQIADIRAYLGMRPTLQYK